METEADRIICGVKDYIDTATRELSKVVIDQAPGSKDYNKDYKKELQNALIILLEIRDKL